MVVLSSPSRAATRCGSGRIGLGLQARFARAVTCHANVPVGQRPPYTGLCVPVDLSGEPLGLSLSNALVETFPGREAEQILVVIVHAIPSRIALGDCQDGLRSKGSAPAQNRPLTATKQRLNAVLPSAPGNRDMRIEFRILGPLELSVDGRPLPLGSPKQRALLALLLVHANETVSRDRLIEELWGDAAPSTVESAFHVSWGSETQSALCGGLVRNSHIGFVKRIRTGPKRTRE
jgi:hypothetical protein